MEIFEPLRKLESQKERRKFLDDLKMPILVDKKDGFYHGRILGTGIISKDSNLSKLYQELENKKESYFQDLIEMSGEDLIKYPEIKIFGIHFKKNLLNFALKSSIFSTIFSLFLFFPLKLILSW